VTDALRVLPLGGLGEIGKNMTVIEYGGRIVVVDTGLRFPTTEMLGIDLVLPDFAYLATTQITKEAKFQGARGLPELLKEAGPASFRDFLEKVAIYPGLVAAVDRFYGEGFLPGLAAYHRDARQKQARDGKSILAPTCVPDHREKHRGHQRHLEQLAP